MQINEIIASIDEELARLNQVKALLGEKRNGVTALSGSVPDGQPKSRTMSAEGRARIAEAQRKRWAKQKRQSKRAA
ncbi:MAG TPA: hypothetical protein VFU86_10640 [Terriglobales bacterium]|nr:hypothetical protein [Terriglobales bacterium]